VADVDVGDDEFITHGICPECLASLRETGESK
jgi:hypothetical protein